MWKPDGKGFYFVSNRDGTFNLWEHDLASGKDVQRTSFKGDVLVERLRDHGFTFRVERLT